MALTRLGGANAITGTIPNSVLAAGNVIQVVSSGEATPATINSTSYVLSISLAITPTSASNKILIEFTGQYQQDDANGYTSSTKLTRTVGGTETTIFDQSTGTDSSDGAAYFSPNYVKLDEPNTISEVTYKIYGKTANSSSDWRTRPHTMLNAFEILG